MNQEKRNYIGLPARRLARRLGQIVNGDAVCGLTALAHLVVGALQAIIIQ